MSIIRISLPLDVLSPNLFFCLSGAEQVGCKLRTAHMVQYVLTLFEPFFLMNPFSSQAIVQATIAEVLKNGIIQRGDYPGVMSRICQF